MPEYHKVAQGEYLTKIAAQYGFADFHTIWDHPKNATLKQKRQNPNVLFPGDVLFVPDKQDKQAARGTTQAHKFQVKPPLLQLRLLLAEQYSKPIANTRLSLESEGTVIALLTTDSAGKIEQFIPVTAQQAKLTAVQVPSPLEGTPLVIRIGHLDPVTEVSGQKARLNNLGYDAGQPENETQLRFRSAVEEFQCDHHLAVDGKCGSHTQAKLVEVHGC